MPGGRPPKYKTPDQLKHAIQKYFRRADKQEKPYTIPGLALFLGFISRQSIIDYEKRDKEYSFPIKKARTRIEAQRNEMLLDAKGNPAGKIFDLKNNFGWKDVQTVENLDNVPRLPEGIEEQDLEQIVREVLNRSKPAEVTHLSVAGKSGK